MSSLVRTQTMMENVVSSSHAILKSSSAEDDGQQPIVFTKQMCYNYSILTYISASQSILVTFQLNAVVTCYVNQNPALDITLD